MNKVKVNSFIIASVFVSNMIANSISVFINISNIFAFIVITLGIASILCSGISFTKAIVLTNLLILIQFLFSFLYINSEMTVRFFLAYITVALPAIIISQKNYHIDLVLKYVEFISITFMPFYIKTISTKYTIYDSGELMGIGYAILPIFLVSIFVLIQRTEKKIVKLIAILNLVFLLKISTQMISRGFFISIFVFLLYLLLVRSRDDIANKTRIYDVLRLMVLVIGFGIFLYSMWGYLHNNNWIYSIFLRKSGNILNGRLFDIKFALNWVSFFNFLFGNGIGSFIQNSGEMYIHNLILMMYYENGFIFTAIMLAFIWKVIVRGIIQHDMNSKYMFALVICTSLIRLMVSYYFWIDPIFWMGIGLITTKQRRLTSESCVGNCTNV